MTEFTSTCEVELVEVHGGDYSIVDAARISYGRRSDQHTEEQNAKLVRRLIRSGHVSTMFIPGVVVRMRMPIFIMREFVRHRIGVEFNELSRRYRDSEDEPVVYFYPTHYRSQHTTDKQRGGELLAEDPGNFAHTILTRFYAQAEATQKELEALGVAKEQARLVMPVGAMTEIYARLTFAAVCRIWELRVHPAAQKEIQDMVAQFDPIMETAFPVAWSIWKEVQYEYKTE